MGANEHFFVRLLTKFSGRRGERERLPSSKRAVDEERRHTTPAVGNARDEVNRRQLLCIQLLTGDVVHGSDAVVKVGKHSFSVGKEVYGLVHGAEAEAVELKLHLHRIRVIASERQIGATFLRQLQMHFVFACFVGQNDGFVDLGVWKA